MDVDLNLLEIELVAPPLPSPSTEVVDPAPVVLVVVVTLLLAIDVGGMALSACVLVVSIVALAVPVLGGAELALVTDAEVVTMLMPRVPIKLVLLEVVMLSEMRSRAVVRVVLASGAVLTVVLALLELELVAVVVVPSMLALNVALVEDVVVFGLIELVVVDVFTGQGIGQLA